MRAKRGRGTQVRVTFPPDLLARVERMAARLGQGRARYIRRAVADRLATNEGELGPGKLDPYDWRKDPEGWLRG